MYKNSLVCSNTGASSCNLSTHEKPELKAKQHSYTPFLAPVVTCGSILTNTDGIAVIIPHLVLSVHLALVRTYICKSLVVLTTYLTAYINEAI